MDFEAGVLHVRQQLSRHRTPKPLKTDAVRREVVLAPAVTRLLRARWLVSSYKEAEHLVFCKTNGRGGDYRAAEEAFRAAVKTAGLQGQGRLSLSPDFWPSYRRASGEQAAPRVCDQRSDNYEAPTSF